jgi:hypothetical protein
VKKLIISEEQYKRLFLLEQATTRPDYRQTAHIPFSPDDVMPYDVKENTKAREKWEEEIKNLKDDPKYAAYMKGKKKEISDYIHKEYSAIYEEKYKPAKDEKRISNNKESQGQIVKYIKEIEELKENYHSPHQKGNKGSCFYITASGGSAKKDIDINGQKFAWSAGHGIIIKELNREGAVDAKRKGKDKLSPYDTAAFVKENNIPAYVYTSLAQFASQSARVIPQVHTEKIYEFFEEYYGSVYPSEIISNIRKYGDIIMGRTWSPKLSERGKWKDALGGINCTTRNNKQKIVFNWLPKGEGALDIILEGLGDFIVYCAGDYHCWLDMASIAALAIPGVGIFVGGGIDILNTMAYLVEARKLEGSNKKLHYLMAAGTMLGTISPVYKGYKVMSSGAKAGQAALKKFGEGYIKLTKGNKLSNQDKVKKLYDDTIGKLTNEKDKIMIQNYFKELSKAGPDVERMVRKIEGFNMSKGLDLQEFLNKNPAKLDEFIKKADDDLFTALDAFRRTRAGREALVQANLFVALGTVLPPLILDGYKGYKELVKSGALQTASVGMMGGIKSQVIAAGFDWDVTKETFGAIATEDINDDDPNYSNKKSGEDNDLLQRAWRAGWRPEKKDKQGNVTYPPVPEKFQTDAYKLNAKIALKDIGEKEYVIEPDGAKRDQSNVIYFNTKAEKEQFEGVLELPNAKEGVPDDIDIGM